MIALELLVGLPMAFMLLPPVQEDPLDREEIQLHDGRILLGAWLDTKAKKGVRRLETEWGVLGVPVDKLALSGTLPPEPPHDAQIAGTWRATRTELFELRTDMAPARAAVFLKRLDPLVRFLAVELGAQVDLSPTLSPRFHCRVFTSLADYRQHRAAFAPSMEAEKSRAFLDGNRGYYGDGGIVMFDPDGAADQSGERGLAVLQHECTHLVLDRLGAFPGLPMWANEGLSVLFSSLLFEDEGYIGVARTAPGVRRAQQLVEGGREVSISQLAAVPYGSFGADEYCLAASFVEMLYFEDPESWRKLIEAPSANFLRNVRHALMVQDEAELNQRWGEYIPREAERLALASRRFPEGTYGARQLAEVDELLQLGLVAGAIEVCEEWLKRKPRSKYSEHDREIYRLLVEAHVMGWESEQGDESRIPTLTAIERARTAFPLDQALARLSAGFALSCLAKGEVDIDTATCELGLALMLDVDRNAAFYLLAELFKLIEDESTRESTQRRFSASFSGLEVDIDLARLQALVDGGSESDRRRWMELVLRRIGENGSSPPPAIALDIAGVAFGLRELDMALAWSRASVADLESWWLTGPFGGPSVTGNVDVFAADELEAVARRLLPAIALELRVHMASRQFGPAEASLALFQKCLQIVPSLGQVWGADLARYERALQ
jgi:hypothetical protein